jgi:hypothetical protein
MNLDKGTEQGFEKEHIGGVLSNKELMEVFSEEVTFKLRNPGWEYKDRETRRGWEIKRTRDVIQGPMGTAKSFGL